jgi:hypothetical protein
VKISAGPNEILLDIAFGQTHFTMTGIQRYIATEFALKVLSIIKSKCLLSLLSSAFHYHLTTSCITSNQVTFIHISNFSRLLRNFYIKLLCLSKPKDFVQLKLLIGQLKSDPLKWPVAEYCSMLVDYRNTFLTSNKHIILINLKDFITYKEIRINIVSLIYW